MSIPDVTASLETSLRIAGTERFDIVGFSACLMAQIEVLSALAPYTTYVVASECTECALGWGYHGFLDALRTEPSMRPADLAVEIVESQIVGDAFVADESARVVGFLEACLDPQELTPELVQDLSEMPHAEILEFCESLDIDFDWIPTPEQKALQSDAHAEYATIAAFDLRAIPDVLEGIHTLGRSLRGMDQTRLAELRMTCRGARPGCWDVYDYVDLICLASRAEGQSNSIDLTDALEDLVIARRVGSELSALSGISIDFSTDCSSLDAYRAANREFVTRTSWDEVLRRHCEFAGQDSP